jgi:hypothetical protein
MADFILPLSIAMGLVSYGLIAKWYLIPHLRPKRLDEALIPLLLFHSFRYVGLAFLIPGVTTAPLDPAFAKPAAYGDLLAALLALLAIFTLRRGLRGALVLVWVFNIEGFLDLLNALYRGFRLTPDGDLGATYFIPAVIVPALLVTHVLIFWLLLSPRSAVARAAPGRHAHQT